MPDDEKYNPPWIPPENNYQSEEFMINIYRLAEPGYMRSIKHVPSGIEKSFCYRPGDDIPRYPMRLLMAELIRELLGKSIPPQPPKIGIKKVGKPRWSEAERAASGERKE